MGEGLRESRKEPSPPDALSNRQAHPLPARLSLSRDVEILRETEGLGIVDRVGGPDAGADDSIQKPLGLAELEARLRVALRRRSTWRDVSYHYCPLSFDTVSRSIAVEDSALDFT